MKRQLTTSPKKDGTKQTLEKVTHHLRERVKELNCLYAISELVEEPGISVTELLRQTIRVIPSAWQYPDIACARIITDDGIFESPGFTETPWKLSAGFSVTDGVKGVLEVCYREPSPPCDEGPFLKEEVKLAKEIAEKVGKILLAKRTEVSLKESEERYRVLAEQVKDGVTLVQEGKLLFANQAFVEMFGLRAADWLMGKPVSEWMSNGRPPSIEPLFDLDERGSSTGEKF